MNPRSHIPSGHRGRLPGFTLIELLAAIAIIGVLTALLFAAGTGVRRQGKTTRCLSNLRQIGVAVRLYENEHQGRLPSSGHDRAPDGSSLSWTNTLATYLTPDFIGRCPAVPDHPAKVTYALNDLLTEADGAGIRLTACRNPSATLFVGEIAADQSSEHFHFAGAARGRVTSALFRSFVNVGCHGTGANYLFIDGHVRTLAWPEVQNRLAETNSTFLQP